MCGRWTEPWLTAEMCGQGEWAPCVPQLQCQGWLKPRVGCSKIRDPEREALKPNKCVEQAGAKAQERFPWGQCVHTAQGQGHNMQETLGDYVAMCPSLWNLHAGAPGLLELKNTPEGGGGGSLGRKLSWKWFRPQSPHPVREAVNEPGCQGGWSSVCLSPQRCWSDSPLGAEMVFILSGRWPES